MPVACCKRMRMWARWTGQEPDQDGIGLRSRSREHRVPSSQVAGTPVFESLDFDVDESEQRLARGLASSSKPCRRSAFLALRWILVILTGVGAGVTGAAIDFLLGELFSMRYGLVKHIYESTGDRWLAVSVNAGCCVLLASIAGALVCFVEPLAAGSGIPEVKCYLNGVDLPRVVTLRTYVAKAIGVLFSVAAGLPCGKEGPMIHSGAIIGGLLSRIGASAFPADWHAELEARDLVTAGGAAGVAVAFGAPLGGVLFAMEEGSSFWNGRVFLRAFVGTAACAMTLSCLQAGLQLDKDIPRGTLGDLGVLTFGATIPSAEDTYRMWELPVFAAIGAVGGVVGAGFNGLNTPLTRWRMKYVRARGMRRFLEVLCVALTIAILRFVVPLATDSCYVPHVHAPAGNSTDYWISCTPEGSRGPGQASTVGLFTAPGEDCIKALLHDNHDFDLGILLAFWAITFMLACWTYGLGVPSGLFVPSLLVGAAMGRAGGQVLRQWAPQAVRDPGSYALVGAAATLAGMARITISLTVILVEATGNTQWVLPLLLTVTVAKWVGDFFNVGIYDIHIRLKRVPLLEPFPERDMRHMRVSDVMGQEVVVLEQVLPLAVLLERLGRCQHHGFPVVDPETRGFAGTIQRSVLEALLRLAPKYHTALLVNPLASTGNTDVQEAPPALSFSLLAHEMRAASKTHSEQDVSQQQPLMQLASDGLAINLGPYMNSSALAVRPDMTLRRAYSLYRGLGLRHLPVTTVDGQVCGMLTRKDFILVEMTEA